MNLSSMLKVILITLIIGAAAQIAPADNDSELGIAAKYPGDKGIEKNPAVIFAAGFEGQNKLAGFTKRRAPNPNSYIPAKTAHRLRPHGAKTAAGP